MDECTQAAHAGLEGLTVRKTKAHATTKRLMEGSTSVYELHGNTVADRFSRLAAHRGRVNPNSVDVIRAMDKKAMIVQRRLLHVTQHPD